jgi:hypothetical protein
MHSGALEASSDGDFASGFEDAGRGTEALFVELCISHAVAIAMNVESAASGIGGVGDIGPEHTNNGVQFAVVQLRATRGCSLFGLVAG